MGNDNRELQSLNAEVDVDELSAEELDEVAGGGPVAGGLSPCIGCHGMYVPPKAERF